MTKIERVTAAQGEPSRVGMAFVMVAGSLERAQTVVMRFLATIVVGRRAIRAYERVYGGGARPKQWWVISRWSICHGHPPGPGGWFWSGRIGPVGYSCGWGDPSKWNWNWR